MPVGSVQGGKSGGEIAWDRGLKRARPMGVGDWSVAQCNSGGQGRALLGALVLGNNGSEVLRAS